MVTVARVTEMGGSKTVIVSQGTTVAALILEEVDTMRGTHLKQEGWNTVNSAVKDSLIAVTAEDPEGFQGGGGAT